MEREEIKSEFLQQLQACALTLKAYVSTPDNQWTIKGFIDVFKNIYTISADTKIISKILEIHLFSRFLEFANQYDYELILAEKQNWYPDLSFVSRANPERKFAVDLKTTYRLEENPAFCNGFTLGSHGEYFTNRNSTKNIQFPYNQYFGHYSLGILYSRKALTYLEEVEVYELGNLQAISSVIGNFEFFAQEKWKIASDKSGSGNTANIGSITYIEDILQGNGVFAKLGEHWFDEYWSNYGKIKMTNAEGQIIERKNKKGENIPKTITNIQDYLLFRGKDVGFIKECAVKEKTIGNTKESEND